MWLSDLQRAFGEVLRQPPTSPQASEASTALSSALHERSGPSALARLSTYRRQYWLRLLGVLAETLPLTRSLLSEDGFLRLCEAYLQDHPPRSHDLNLLTTELPTFAGALKKEVLKGIGVGETDGELVRAALQVDEAYARLVLAPEPRALEPWPADSRGLEGRILPLACHCALVEDRFGLVPRRRAVTAKGPLPAHGPREQRLQRWLLVGERAGIRTLPLTTFHGELLMHVQTHTLASALSALTAATPQRTPVQVVAEAQRCLTGDVRLGIFRDQPRRTTEARKKP